MASVDSASDVAGTPRWLHRWAVATACATFVLLALGSLVTTRRAGMADPVWPTYPWHLMLVSWEEPRPGFLLEHSHRLAGYVVGCCTIVLAAGLWRTDPRRWVRGLGLLSLAGIIVQGLLGGYRVKLDQWLGPDLALVHGCFAQLVFSLLVSLALFTSSSWMSSVSGYSAEETLRTRRSSLLTAVLVYVQIVFGAVLRHTYSPLGPRGHLLVAAAVVAAVAWLFKEVWENFASERLLVVNVTILAVLVALQLFMGVEALMIRYLSAAGVGQQILVRTIHVLLGFLIFATSVTTALLSQRLTVPAHRPAPVPVGRLEGAI